MCFFSFYVIKIPKFNKNFKFNIMKRVVNLKLILLVVSAVSILSCKKDQPINDESPLPQKKAWHEDGGDPGGPTGTIQSSKVVFINGEFYVSAAGGLHFGPSFTYPTNKYAYANYTPFTPSWSGLTGDSNLLDFKMDGHKFVAVLGTVVGGLVYKMNTKEYFEKLKTSIPQVSEYVTSAGGSADGLIIVTGKFLIDHDAPFGVAVFAANAHEVTELLVE